MDSLAAQNETKEKRIKDLELELKYADFQRQGQKDGEMMDMKAKHATNMAEQNRVVIEHLSEKNQNFMSSLSTMRKTDEQ